MAISRKITNVVVAVSGAGRSLKNLVQKQQVYGNYRVVGVIASSESCDGLLWSRDNKLPCYLLKTHCSDGNPPQELANWLNELECDVIALAGFIKIFPVKFQRDMIIINIHPSLLPRYGGKGMYGKSVHEAVFASGDAQSGATVHFVNNLYDDGQIISQIKVNIKDCKNPAEIASKVFIGETELYPLTLSKLAKGELPLAQAKIYEYSIEQLK